jgi:hypothetical protein
VEIEKALIIIANGSSIEQWEDSNKFVVNFTSPAEATKPIKLAPKSKVKAPQAPRYSSKAKLDSAKSLDGFF